MSYWWIVLFIAVVDFLIVGRIYQMDCRRRAFGRERGQQ